MQSRGGRLKLTKRILYMCWAVWALLTVESRANTFASPAALTPPFSSDSSQPEEATLNPLMTCTGGYLPARTCYFEDILWDVAKGRFVFYGTTFSQPHVFSDDLRSSDEIDISNPWIILRRHVNKPPPKKWTWHEFYMDWRLDQEHPPASAIADAPYTAVHLRTVVNPRSFGHLLRDNLMPLVNVPLRFGQDPRDFVWVMCASNLQFQNRLSTTLPILRHYESWIPSRKGQPNAVLWTEMISKVVNGYGQGSKPAFIRFPKLVAGRGSTALDVQHNSPGTTRYEIKDLSSWGHFCSPWPWREMRAVAYGNNGITMTPAAQLKPLVLLIDGKPHERRHFTNGDDVLEHLKHKLPGVEVQRVLMSTLSGEEQIQLLARTTVMISNIGSRSFRMLYLPDGAQMILVGPPENKIGRAGLTRSSFTRPFHEAERCWAFLGYINLLRHHAIMRANVNRGPSVRQMNITLDKDALFPVVRHALENVRLWTIPDFSTGKSM